MQTLPTYQCVLLRNTEVTVHFTCITSISIQAPFKLRILFIIYLTVIIAFTFSTQETTATIVFRLLDRVVAAERIPNAIAKYIAPYMVHHSLDRDTMLLRYIEVMEMEIKLNYII